MKTPSTWLENISVFLYRRLLVLYPADFRHAYGAQMLQLFMMRVGKRYDVPVFAD